MKPLTTPSEFYVVHIDFGPKIGVGMLTDDYADFGEAVDRVMDFWSTHKEAPAIRAFKISMDVMTNAPETVSDVTTEIWDAALRLAYPFGDYPDFMEADE